MGLSLLIHALHQRKAGDLIEWWNGPLKTKLQGSLEIIPLKRVCEILF